MPALSPRLQRVQGDALDPADLDRALPGHDAVVITMGIHESALRVRRFGPARTPADVRSTGTREVVAATKRHGVRRLVVQTSCGVGPTRAQLPLTARLFFALLLKPQIADTEQQEQLVRASGLDWLIVQPVNLTDEAKGDVLVSTTGQLRSLTGRGNRWRRAWRMRCAVACRRGARWRCRRVEGGCGYCGVVIDGGRAIPGGPLPRRARDGGDRLA